MRTSSNGSGPAIRENYQSKGYVTPIDVLSPSEAAKLRSSYDTWVSSLPDGKLVGDLRFRPHLYLPFINDIVHHKKIVSVVQEVLGTSNVLLWSSDFNVKDAGSGGYFSLHQDATYTGLSPAELGVTVWLAISDNVNEQSGCMAFIEGSHIFSQLPHVEGVTSRDSGLCCNNMLSRKQTVLDDRASRGQRVVASLQAGQASLHHFYLLHKSGPNNSAHPRIGLALRYIAASVTQTGKVREAVMLVSGTVEHDNFDLEPTLPLVSTATEADVERGKAAHRDSMRRESANYFDTADTVKAYDEDKVIKT